MPSYRVEYHRVWVKAVEAENREEARRIAEEEMSEEPDAEDYSYSVVKRKQINRDSGGDGHNGVWGS
jgi:hypothetical protein